MSRKRKLFLSLLSVAVVIVFLLPAAMAATQTIQGDIYKIVVNAKGGKATITITPKTVKGVHHHCNQEFPWRLAITEAEGVKTDQVKYTAPYKKPDGSINSPSHTKTFSEKKVVFEVKYTVAAGKKVNAKLTFSVCDNKQCYRKKEMLEWN